MRSSRRRHRTHPRSSAVTRPDDEQDIYFDQYVHAAIEEHGEAAVEECIRLTLTKNYPHRSAGITVFSDDNYLYGADVRALFR